ncbi:MAG: PTS sugar transporter subunit IIA [Pseudomonadota bacterium]
MGQLLTTSAICLDCASQSKKRVLEHAAHLLSLSDPMQAEQIFARLLARERLGSTGLTAGVALPHARLPDLTHSRGTFIRLRQAIDFDSQDGQLVDLVFVLLVPETAQQDHLHLLAQLAALFRDTAICQQLRGLSDVHQVHQLFSQVISNAT